MISHRSLCFRFLWAFFLFPILFAAQSQIYEPDGLRAPGDWNGFSNSLNMGGDFDLDRITAGATRWTTTFQYTGSTGSVAFKFASGGGNPWANQWSGHTFTMDAVNSVGYGDFSNNSVNLVQNSWYTIVFRDNGYAMTDVSFMETSAEPVTISSSTRTTATATNPGPGQAVVISVELSGEKSAEENVYLVYTTNNWATRTPVTISSFTGSTGSATIPGQAANASVNYYVMTSTMTLDGVDATEEAYDLRSIAVGGAGSYTVASSWTTVASPTTWSVAGSWTAGEIPEANTPVTIGGDLTLDQNVEVSTLTISSGATLTASDETSRTITISSGGSIANSGTFAAATGKVVFAGSGTVTGTTSFNDVSLSGGVDFGGNSTITGTLQILPSGFVDTNAPTYGISSTLHYDNNNSYGIGTEWSSPHHVVVGEGVTLNFGSSAARSCGGDLTVSATGALDMQTMAAPLTVAGGVTIAGTLSMSSAIGGDLKVGGNFQLSVGGTFNENDRALEFNGTGAQAITGPELTLKYMILDKASGTLTLNTPLNFEAGGVFWPTAGTMDLNGNALTMHSDATGTAVVGAVGATVTGDITFERYVPDNTNDEASFVNLSSYVAEINASNWTGAGANYIFEYDETNTGGLNDGWVATTGNLTVGKGYMAQFPGTTEVTLSYTGALTSGDQTINATYTSTGNASNDGWNLIGNPYPCAVGFGNLEWTGATPGGYYVWNEDAGGYNGSAYADGTIAVGQSFWVQLDANATVTFQEADKVTGSDPFVRSALDPVVFGLRATEESGKWSRAIRSLDLNATEAFEFGHDMRTLGDPTEESRVMVWFETSDNETVAIHATHPSEIGPTIVHLFAVEGGDVVLELDPSMEVPEGLCLTLEDTDTGAVYDLTSDEVATVTVQPGTVYNERFVLHTTLTPAPEVTPTWCHQGVIDMGMDGEELASWNVAWNGMGQSGLLDGDMLSGLLPGTYTLTWDQNGMCAGQTELDVMQPCMGDFNADGHRGTGDLLVLVAHMSMNANDAASADVLALHDCNCDGALGVHDVLTFLTAFGSPCNTIE